MSIYYYQCHVTVMWYVSALHANRWKDHQKVNKNYLWTCNDVILCHTSICLMWWSIVRGNELYLMLELIFSANVDVGLWGVCCVLGWPPTSELVGEMGKVFSC